MVLFITDPLGSVATHGVRFLRALSRLAQQTGHRDGTVYGTARTSTTSFFVHHLSALSRALVKADALTLMNAAATNDLLGAWLQPASRLKRAKPYGVCRRPALPARHMTDVAVRSVRACVL